MVVIPFNGSGLFVYSYLFAWYGMWLLNSIFGGNAWKYISNSDVEILRNNWLTPQNKLLRATLNCPQPVNKFSSFNTIQIILLCYQAHVNLQLFIDFYFWMFQVRMRCMWKLHPCIRMTKLSCSYVSSHKKFHIPLGYLELNCISWRN
jgi:hypothetical protein